MQKIQIKFYAIRKILVIFYFLFYRLGILVLVGSLLIFFIRICTYIYTESHTFTLYVTQNSSYAQYVSLTLLMILIEPLYIFTIKFINRCLIVDGDKDSMTSVVLSYFARLWRIVNKIPLKGMLHILYFCIIVVTNTNTLLELDWNLKSSVIYMSLITYYACEKVWSYFKDKYKEYIEILDNKYFFTNKVKENDEMAYDKMMDSINLAFINYVETGDLDFGKISISV